MQAFSGGFAPEEKKVLSEVNILDVFDFRRCEYLDAARFASRASEGAELSGEPGTGTWI